MTYQKTVIGDATLYLGDCLEVMADMPGGSVDAVVTDPPYGMDFQSNHKIEQYDKIKGDNNSLLLLSICDFPVPHSKYIFCRWENLADVPTPKSCITWVKNNWSMGDLEHEHARMTEIILFYPGKDHSFPQKRPLDIVKHARSGNEYHPTEKPVGLIMELVGWTNGIVVDPFMGSGTTGVACANLGRKFIGVENEQQYFDVACRRIEMAQSQLKLDLS